MRRAGSPGRPGARVCRHPAVVMAAMTAITLSVAFWLSRLESARPAGPRQSPRAQVVRYVDGGPFQVADYPYTVRWRLAAGEHVFQARLIDGRTASTAVHVLVQKEPRRIGGGGAPQPARPGQCR
jgi:hypothetical protein